MLKNCSTQSMIVELIRRLKQRKSKKYVGSSDEIDELIDLLLERLNDMQVPHYIGLMPHR